MSLDRYLRLPDPGELEESVRVDRDVGSRDEQRTRVLSEFQVTDAAREFLEEFLDRLTGQEEGDRRGWNHWLYGYYGSGKSHLLALCGCLLDSTWVEGRGRDEIWSLLAGTREDLGAVRESWNAALDDYHLQPLPLNLLKHQGVRDRSLSRLLVNAANERSGLSSVPRVAAFEKWYREREAWERREAEATEVLAFLGVDLSGSPVWPKIQRYAALAELVLPRLFAEEMGEEEGYYDLARSELAPGLAVQELEAWRQQIEVQTDRPAKLILLLDEITLFVGADYQLLTELQALAENIDEQGRGRILSVATAQARIEDVAPEAAQVRVDFSILKDRFPHQHPLPSRHVGEIVQVRLLKKREEERANLREEVFGSDEATIRPQDSLLYSEVVQNTDPPLNRLHEDDVLDYYPFLPYQLPLFLEILHGLREKVTDRAKSIFSGTARAGLAIAAGLLKEWERRDDPLRLISLPDFYDMIETELRPAIPRKVETIEEIRREHEAGRLEELDVKVAKAVLLLSFVREMIDSTDLHNLAVAVRGRLAGPSMLEMENRVDDALHRLETFVRKPEEAEARAWRFTERDEREILEESRRLSESAGWDDLLGMVGEGLWPELMEELELPGELPYPHGDDVWPITYDHVLDGRRLVDGDEVQGLSLDLECRDILPEASTENGSRADLIWKASDEGVQKARESLRAWASLARAASGHRIPASVDDDLADRKARARKDLAGILRKGSFRVGPHEPSSLSAALERALEEKYPAYFHPVMLQVDRADLPALGKTSRRDGQPRWAQILRIPTGDSAVELAAVPAHVRALAGRQLKQRGPLGLQRLLELVEESEPIYGEGRVRPALAAVLYGLCLQDVFRPTNPSGEPVPPSQLLEPDRWDATRLAIEEAGGSVRKVLERLPAVAPTDDLATARLKLAEATRSIHDGAAGLRQRVEGAREASLSPPVIALLEAFADRLEGLASRAQELSSAIKSSNPTWDEIVDETLEARERLNEARGQWEERQGFVVHLDGLLKISRTDPSWLEPNSRELLEALTEQVRSAAETEWWSRSEWPGFRSALSALEEVREKLSDDWKALLDSGGRRDLFDGLEGHPWMKGPYQLPARVAQSALEREVLRALRHFERACSRGTYVVGQLTRSPTDATVEKLDVAVDYLEQGDWYPEESEEEVGRLRTLFRRVDALVGDRGPEDFEAIGLWRADESALRQALRTVAGERDVSVEPVDGDLRVT